MGTVTKSIGSAGGRDYSTIASWESALPANLVTDGNAQVGECYNDSEFTSTSEIQIAGSTTDATNFITLKCAAGQSFRDNASVQTNALKYNVSNGVGIRRVTNNYNPTLSSTVQYTVFDGLQVAHRTDADVSGQGIRVAGANSTIKNCISQTRSSSTGSFGTIMLDADACTCTNSIAIVKTSTASKGIYINAGTGTARIVNCTIVRSSDKTVGSSGVHIQYSSNGGVTLKNTAIFGFTKEVSNSAKVTATTCATDVASPMSGFTGGLTFTSQFEGTTDAANDFRAKSGGGLIDTGTTDTTYGTPDIANTARPSGSAYDIGCWELVAAAASFIWDGARAFTHMMVR